MSSRALVLTCLATLLCCGCGPDSTEISPVSQGGGAGGASIDAGDDAPDTGGTGGMEDAALESDAPVNTSRGDPARFPTDCLATCQESCARLDACGASQSAYPLDQSECLARCDLAVDGPVWDDISANFRCCASQAECGDVATCGGWLAHPDPVPSCEKLCDCFVGGATVPPPPAGATAPPGYRFATDAVVFEGGALQSPGGFGLQVLYAGTRSAVRFASPVDRAQLAVLSGGARVLPTFYDTAGRLVAAHGSIVLVLGSPDALHAAEKVARDHGLPAPTKLKYGDHLYTIEASDPWKSVLALPHFSAIPGVVAELDMVRHYVPTFIPNDPLFQDQWHLRNLGKNHAIAGVDGRVSEAWDVTRGSPDVVIAINDDGMDVNHPDLRDNCLSPLNFPADWEQKMTTTGFGWHGSSCAGVAAAVGNNAVGVSGVCPRCKLLPHLLGESTGMSFSVTDKEIADGFVQMVDAGAWIISNSWGMALGDPNFEVSSFQPPPAATVVKSAWAYAETQGRGGKGTVILFAAGNENEPTDSYTGYATNLGVAAVDDQGLKAYYSNWGPGIAIAAPSNGGLNGITTTAAGGAYTADFGGTSSACPFAAGVAGLVLSANPDLTAAEVRAILKASATKIDPVWGKYDTNGHSPYYGAGMVNAYRAVRMAKGDCATADDCPAPSDQCLSGCDKTQCGPCRSDAECGAGYVCQAVPPLGRSVCVQRDDGNGCPAETESIAGYCIPTRQACNLCSEEACNGRDDDCNGVIDDGDVCEQPVADCTFLGRGCASGEICAANHCVPGCVMPYNCKEDGAQCLPVKDRYGAFDAQAKGCYVDTTAQGCTAACQVLVSSLDDAKMANFIDCMGDGAAACSTVQQCALQLPISY